MAQVEPSPLASQDRHRGVGGFDLDSAEGTWGEKNVEERSKKQRSSKETPSGFEDTEPSGNALGGEDVGTSSNGASSSGPATAALAALGGGISGPGLGRCEEPAKQTTTNPLVGMARDEPPFLASASGRAAADAAPTTLYTFSASPVGRILTFLSQRLVRSHNRETHGGSALAGFLALLHVTCANYMLGPMRDAAALAVGVSHIPALTLASTVLALASSVPVGWLFEAPDPRRRKLWKRMGMTRGETQGTSLALFYRVFAVLLVGYAVGFQLMEILGEEGDEDADATAPTALPGEREHLHAVDPSSYASLLSSLVGPVRILIALVRSALTGIIQSRFGKLFYVFFFLVVHLMKLHSLSLIWGVTSEAMEYEEQAEKRELRRKEIEEHRAQQLRRVGMGGWDAGVGAGGVTRQRKPVLESIPSGKLPDDAGMPRNHTTDSVAPTRAGPSTGIREEEMKSTKEPSPHLEAKTEGSGNRSRARLKRLAFVGFGGTLGGIAGSVIASLTAHILRMSGLLLVAAVLLELSANLSIELGRIMQRHWEEQQRIQSCDDLVSLASQSDSEVDTSIKRVSSLGSMKRVASGNSLFQRRSSDSGAGMRRAKSSSSINSHDKLDMGGRKQGHAAVMEAPIDDNSFSQRLLRGVTTILRSRLLMAIFTYNALYASTSVLLSFERAELVANRSSNGSSSSAVADTAFLAKVNMASSVAVFALQASGLGAYLANSCGQRGTLALMPLVRLCGVLLLGWWHIKGGGAPPNLTLFLVLDEFCKVINFAVAKPVRESLWRGLSNEARYEAKPIVDTLANRWGGGSAAFCASLIGKIIDWTNIGEVGEDGTKTILGFPPVLLLCMIVAAWWTMVSADVGNIRRRIDIELKKQQ